MRPYVTLEAAERILSPFGDNIKYADNYSFATRRQLYILGANSYLLESPFNDPGMYEYIPEDTVETGILVDVRMWKYPDIGLGAVGGLDASGTASLNGDLFQDWDPVLRWALLNQETASLTLNSSNPIAYNSPITFKIEMVPGPEPMPYYQNVVAIQAVEGSKTYLISIGYDIGVPTLRVYDLSGFNLVYTQTLPDNGGGSIIVEIGVYNALYWAVYDENHSIINRGDSSDIMPTAIKSYPIIFGKVNDGLPGASAYIYEDVILQRRPLIT